MAIGLEKRRESGIFGVKGGDGSSWVKNGVNQPAEPVSEPAEIAGRPRPDVTC
jgi:hypothetical protein